MQISMIVAMAKNRVIGKNGQLPWHLPSDLKRFKDLTMGHTLLMGRKTFESIGKALPGRRTIVVSRNPDFRMEGCETAADIDSAMRLARSTDELFICGGAEVYRQTLPLVERIYLTELESAMEGDTFFPQLPPGRFRTINSRFFNDKVNYFFSILQRCDDNERFNKC